MFWKQYGLQISLLVLFTLLGGAFWYRQHHRYKHFAVHQEGMIYRSAWLEPDVMAELIEKYQFRSVVNLCAPGELGESRWVAERQAVELAGAKLIELPMPFQVEPGDQIIKLHIEMFADPNNYPMLIHCQHGVTRTAKELVMYDVIFRKMSVDQSLKSMPLFGRPEHNVNITSFAHEFEKNHASNWRIAKEGSLDVLQK